MKLKKRRLSTGCKCDIDDGTSARKEIRVRRTESESSSLRFLNAKEASSLFLSLRLDIDATDRRSRNVLAGMVDRIVAYVVLASNKIALKKSSSLPSSLSCQISRTSVREEFPWGDRSGRKEGRRRDGTRWTGIRSSARAVTRRTALLSLRCVCTVSKGSRGHPPFAKRIRKQKSRRATPRSPRGSSRLIELRPLTSSS